MFKFSRNQTNGKGKNEGRGGEKQAKSIVFLIPLHEVSRLWALEPEENGACVSYV